MFVGVVQASLRLSNMLKYTNINKNRASKAQLGSCDGTWCNKYDGASFITISWIILEQFMFSSTVITFD